MGFTVPASGEGRSGAVCPVRTRGDGTDLSPGQRQGRAEVVRRSRVANSWYSQGQRGPRSESQVCDTEEGQKRADVASREPRTLAGVVRTRKCFLATKAARKGDERAPLTSADGR